MKNNDNADQLNAIMNKATLAKAKLELKEAQRKLHLLRPVCVIKLYITPDSEPLTVKFTKAIHYREKLAELLDGLNRLEAKYNHILSLDSSGIKGWLYDKRYKFDLQKILVELKRLLGLVVKYDALIYSNPPKLKLTEVKVLLAAVALIGAGQYS